MKHLLKLEDWSTEEIINTLNLADQLKYTALSIKFSRASLLV